MKILFILVFFLFCITILGCLKEGSSELQPANPEKFEVYPNAKNLSSSEKMILVRKDKDFQLIVHFLKNTSKRVIKSDARFFTKDPTLIGRSEILDSIGWDKNEFLKTREVAHQAALRLKKRYVITETEGCASCEIAQAKTANEKYARISKMVVKLKSSPSALKRFNSVFDKYLATDQLSSSRFKSPKLSDMTMAEDVPTTCKDNALTACYLGCLLLPPGADVLCVFVCYCGLCEGTWPDTICYNDNYIIFLSRDYNA